MCSLLVSAVSLHTKKEGGSAARVSFWQDQKWQPRGGQAVEDENKEVRGEPPVAQTADWSLPKDGGRRTVHSCLALFIYMFFKKLFHITAGNNNGHPVQKKRFLDL